MMCSHFAKYTIGNLNTFSLVADFCSARHNCSARDCPSPEVEHCPRGRVFLPMWMVAVMGEQRGLGCGLSANRCSKAGTAETHGL